MSGVGETSTWDGMHALAASKRWRIIDFLYIFPGILEAWRRKKAGSSGITCSMYHLVRILKLVSCVFVQIEDLYVNLSMCRLCGVLKVLSRSRSHSVMLFKTWGSVGVISNS